MTELRGRVTMLAPFGLQPKTTLAQRMLPLAAGLSRRGWECGVVAPSYLEPSDAGRGEVVDGVRIEHIGLSWLPSPAAFLEIAVRMVQAAMRQRPDVLHVFKPKGYSGLAAHLAHVIHPSIPQVQDTDDWEGWGGWNDLLPYPALMKYFFAWQERTLPQQAAAVTVASRTLETQIWGFGVHPQRVAYLPNGVLFSPLILPEREEARVPTVLVSVRHEAYRNLVWWAEKDHQMSSSRMCTGLGVQHLSVPAELAPVAMLEPRVQA